MSRFKRGDICYFIANNCKVKEATVTGVNGDFYVLRYDGIKGIRLCETRLYQTYKDAWTIVEPRLPKLTRRRSTPYDYDHLKPRPSPTGVSYFYRVQKCSSRACLHNSSEGFTQLKS